MGSYISNGKSIKVTASGAMTKGVFYYLGGHVGWCFKTVADGEDTTLNLEGEYRTTQIDTADDFTVGTRIYWDTVESRFTEDSASGLIECGIVTQAKDTNNVIHFNLYQMGTIVP